MNISTVLSPNQQMSPGRRPQFIILHGSGGGEQGSISWIGDQSSRVSYHYFLPKDGDPQAYNLVLDENIAWHAGSSKWVEGENGPPRHWSGMNRHSIGVCFESMNRHDEQYTDEQIENGVVLVRMLMGRWGIPTSRVLTHKEISDPQGRKVDPVNFPLQDFRNAIRSEAERLLSLRLFLNDNDEGRIARAGLVADKLYLYTEV